MTFPFGGVSVGNRVRLTAENGDEATVTVVEVRRHPRNPDGRRAINTYEKDLLRAGEPRAATPKTRTGWTRKGLIDMARRTPVQPNWKLMQDLADALEASMAEVVSIRQASAEKGETDALPADAAGDHEPSTRACPEFGCTRTDTHLHGCCFMCGWEHEPTNHENGQGA